MAADHTGVPCFALMPLGVIRRRYIRVYQSYIGGLFRVFWSGLRSRLERHEVVVGMFGVTF